MKFRHLLLNQCFIDWVLRVCGRQQELMHREWGLPVAVRIVPVLIVRIFRTFNQLIYVVAEGTPIINEVQSLELPLQTGNLRHLTRKLFS